MSYFHSANKRAVPVGVERAVCGFSGSQGILRYAQHKTVTGETKVYLRQGITQVISGANCC